MAESFYSQLLSNATTFIAAASKPVDFDMYPGVNVAALNIFERAWMNWYEYWGNPILATGIMSFVMHEVRYHSLAVRWKGRGGWS